MNGVLTEQYLGDFAREINAMGQPLTVGSLEAQYAIAELKERGWIGEEIYIPEAERMGIPVTPGPGWLPPRLEAGSGYRPPGIPAVVPNVVNTGKTPVNDITLMFQQIMTGQQGYVDNMGQLVAMIRLLVIIAFLGLLLRLRG